MPPPPAHALPVAKAQFLCGRAFDHVVLPPNTGTGIESGSNQGRLERGSKCQGACGLPEELATSGRRGEGSVQVSRPKATPAEKTTLVKKNRVPKRTGG